MRLWRRSKHDTGGKTLGHNIHLGCLCLSLGAEKELRVDKAPRPSIGNVIWILSSDTICQLNQSNTIPDGSNEISEDNIT